MVLLKYNKIDENKGFVYQKIYTNFDKYGDGVLVEQLPAEEQIEGKVGYLYINPKTNDLWYEYVDAVKEPPTTEEEIEMLKQSIAELTMMIAGK